MISTLEDLKEALTYMKLSGGDSLALEAKTSSDFSSNSIGPSLSSLANLPGGGVILLGIDERKNELVVGVTDPHNISQKISNLARNGMSNPIRVEPSIIHIDGKNVVAINVYEASINDKPISYKDKAYVRQYDGDYAISLQERQQFLRRHQRPRDDRMPVEGTSIKDLDKEAIKSFTSSVRRSTPALLSSSDEEIMHRLNVLSTSGEATIAGLYALGVYPQQYLPHLSLTAAVIDPTHDDVRGTNRTDFTGPIPEILDGTLDWVAQNISRSMVVTKDGHAHDDFAFPLVAVREIVANALVHRDLSDAASGRVVELRLTAEGLILTSPGGLWGLSVDQLGTPDGKSAVNEFLYGICRHISGRSGRVIEAMGTGIYATRKALAEAGLEPPIFIDNSLRFTVRFPNHALHSESELVWLSHLPIENLNNKQKEFLLFMSDGKSVANSDYRYITNTDSTMARLELQELVDRGLLIRTGQRRGTRYHIAPHFLHNK